MYIYIYIHILSAGNETLRAHIFSSQEILHKRDNTHDVSMQQIKI
jgi:hypothetical protein